MLEEFVKTGREVKVIFHNTFGTSSNECLFGEIVSIDNNFIKLYDHRKQKTHYISLREVISVGER